MAIQPTLRNATIITRARYYVKTKVNNLVPPEYARQAGKVQRRINAEDKALGKVIDLVRDM